MSRPPQDSSDPFADYHRARRSSAVARIALIGVPTAALIVGMFAMGSLATAQAAPVLTTVVANPNPTPTPTPTAPPTALPDPGPAAEAAAPAAPDATTPPVDRIAITATGYQTELDQCQWVRMDLGLDAPIVGAHTRCGGAIVLGMHSGDVVQLIGQGLDGRYVVTDGRDAHAGDDAETATDGMNGQVILQTCYPGTGGRERLVGLQPQS